MIEVIIESRMRTYRNQLTGNQKVRSLRQVGDDVAAFNILTNTDNQGC